MSDDTSKIIAALIIDALLLLLFALFAMWLWNITFPALIVGVSAINYGQSVCLLVFVRILTVFARTKQG